MIPFDILPPRVTPQQLRGAVADAAAVHMNMLRVWGGGGYLPAAFYDACDEAGLLVWQVGLLSSCPCDAIVRCWLSSVTLDSTLLVWQEAMFACACYPRDCAFLAEVRSCTGCVASAANRKRRSPHGYFVCR